MGMTITEKIIASHAGQDQVRPGQLVTARVDIALGSDTTAPLAIEQFYRSGAKQVYDPDKVVMVPDHFAPNVDSPLLTDDRGRGEDVFNVDERQLMTAGCRI